MDTGGKNVKPGAAHKLGLPFYGLPPRKTSAEIINEAKMAIKGVDLQVADNSYAIASIKPLETQRPFTPREKERLLFGKKTKPNRPPSSFSLRYLQSENELSAPINNAEEGYNASSKEITNNNGTISKRQRAGSISSLNETTIFNTGVKDVGVQKIKLPSLESAKATQKKRLCTNTFSMDDLPEESEVNTATTTRNAYSSPLEKTDYNETLRNESPFGRPSKKTTLSECLLLGPQNLNKIFGNKQIIEHSGTLFGETGKPKMKADKSVNDIIDTLNVQSTKSDNERIIIDLLDELYSCMSKENMLTVKVNSKTKIFILKSLYKFVESQNEELLLGLARIILALKVTGNNLSGVCKLIFKVSKSDKNDTLFFQKNILELFIDSIGRCSPLEDAEACVYGYGAIKFLTMNPKILQRSIDLGILPLMVLHLKLVNNFKLEKHYLPEQTNHALFQLTGALRHLANDDDIYDLFADTQAVAQLCLTLDLFSSDIDIVTNISRTLSTLSTNDHCSDHISEYSEIYKVLIRLFDKYPGNDEIIIRLTYALGNIVAKIDDVRVQFYDEGNGVTSLINLWKAYFERTLKSYSLRADNEGDDPGNNEDVMIKVIRVIANIAINPEIGKRMNHQYGVQLIDEFLKVLISNPFKRNEELVLSALSTLNNLSFYYSSDMDSDVFHVKQVDIMEAILEYIAFSKKESVIEAMRILGNLSRSSVTRHYIAQQGILQNLLDILDKDDVNLLRTTIGVFVNLMADNRNRINLRNAGGVSKLIKVMSTYGQRDWSLAMLACQVIWNFCIDASNLYELVTDTEIEQLMTLLVDFLDEESLFGTSDAMASNDVLVTPEYLMWEEFANVATNLLEKMEQFLDTVEEIDVDAPPENRDSSTNISYSSW